MEQTKKIYSKVYDLKGPTGQIRSDREWYQWRGLYVSKDMPRYKVFCFLDFNLDF